MAAHSIECISLIWCVLNTKKWAKFSIELIWNTFHMQRRRLIMLREFAWEIDQFIQTEQVQCSDCIYHLFVVLANFRIENLFRKTKQIQSSQIEMQMENGGAYKWWLYVFVCDFTVESGCYSSYLYLLAEWLFFCCFECTECTIHLSFNLYECALTPHSASVCVCVCVCVHLYTIKMKNSGNNNNWQQ